MNDARVSTPPSSLPPPADEADEVRPKLSLTIIFEGFSLIVLGTLS